MNDEQLLVDLWRYSEKRTGKTHFPEWRTRGWVHDNGTLTKVGRTALENSPAVMTERLASLTRDGGDGQIASIKLPDGTEVTMSDWQDRPMYSTIDLPRSAPRRAPMASQSEAEARRARRKAARKSRRRNRES
jgi:hypothetical protein